MNQFFDITANESVFFVYRKKNYRNGGYCPGWFASIIWFLSFCAIICYRNACEMSTVWTRKDFFAKDDEHMDDIYDCRCRYTNRNCLSSVIVNRRMMKVYISVKVSLKISARSDVLKMALCLYWKSTVLCKK